MLALFAVKGSRPHLDSFYMTQPAKLCGFPFHSVWLEMVLGAIEVARMLTINSTLPALSLLAHPKALCIAAHCLPPCPPLPELKVPPPPSPLLHLSPLSSFSLSLLSLFLPSHHSPLPTLQTQSSCPQLLISSAYDPSAPSSLLAPPSTPPPS